MKTITTDELKHINHPQFTDTWSPWPHHEVLTEVNNQLEQMGLLALDHHLEVSDNGQDLFGHMTIARFENDSLAPTMHHSKKLGWRNSTQKRFGLGFVAGDEIYVCSNLGFYGDYRETHVHNSQLDEETLKHFIRQAITSIWREMERFDNWYAEITRFVIAPDELKVIAYDLVDQGIIPPSKFRAFQKGIQEERAVQQHVPRESLAHVYGGATRALRGGSVHRTMERTRGLTEYLQELTPALVMSPDEELII